MEEKSKDGAASSVKVELLSFAFGSKNVMLKIKKVLTASIGFAII